MAPSESMYRYFTDSLLIYVESLIKGGFINYPEKTTSLPMTSAVLSFPTTVPKLVVGLLVIGVIILRHGYFFLFTSLDLDCLIDVSCLGNG